MNRKSPSPTVKMGYFRHLNIPSTDTCADCGHIFHEHGWIDLGGDGITVCPRIDEGPFLPDHPGGGDGSCINCEEDAK